MVAVNVVFHIVPRFLQMQLKGLRSYGQSKEGTIPVDELLEDAFSCRN
ncbi:hypothetical protein P4B35_13970 [Pontiellaceae bacterium B12227]|nr:hypothetical protein [Pontiellaceae bacterium B12227]